MFMSILTGNVAPENWDHLERSYKAAVRHAPEGLGQSFLIQNTEDPRIWQIITLWRNREVYELCKTSNQTDTCAQLFCDAGSIPDRTTFQVHKQFTAIVSQTHSWG